MAESTVVSAFRQRASRLGYQEIVIKKDREHDGCYHVRLVEPLVGLHLAFVCPEWKLKILLSQRALKK